MLHPPTIVTSDDGLIAVAQAPRNHADLKLFSFACSLVVALVAALAPAGVTEASASHPTRYIEASLGPQSPGICALTTKHVPRCWDDEANFYTPPKGAYTQISVCGANDNADTDNFACGVRRNRSVRCWSIEPTGSQTGQLIKTTPYGPVPHGKFVQVAAGPDDACGIRPNGRIHWWIDAGNMGTADPLPHDRFTQISLGGGSVDRWQQYYGCGVRWDERIACWGKAWAGNPVLVVAGPPRGHFRQVDVNGAWALRTDGEVSCWQYARPKPSGLDLHYRFIQIQGECGLRRNLRISCSGPNGRHPFPGHSFRQFTNLDGFCGVQLDGTLYPPVGPGNCDLPWGDSQDY